ncbi:hypothetical protein J2Z76_002521 [Sedimentibacter acidaminivorans]|jgi:hypothetical protein|uniref:Uncharacterized protein n=1 Tax=Sedimentibacter acidaminivorans TaxID=913099 RepID=A0ABS4GGI8_9FIRM|nr:hypothetical protein [Sedimentibacter acidaminivorans]MBP1926652.1 hypothetical protein [Sedimentibacter acidaminivorans]
MDNNCNCQPIESEMVDVKNEINEQSTKGAVKSQCRRHGCGDVAGIGGIDSSLLFFFLILVCIVCQCDIGIEMDTLLWFFLLLVVLYQYYL